MYGKWSGNKIVAETVLNNKLEIETVDTVKGINIPVFIEVFNGDTFQVSDKNGNIIKIRKVSKVLWEKD